MGLGKTLTMISTIVSTLIPSRQYLTNPGDDESRPGATLVVVSSAREYPPTFMALKDPLMHGALNRG